MDGIFDQAAQFDPASDLEAFLKQVPAKWVVYLFADEQGQPIQLLCVKNLRASLKRRLGGEEAVEPTRKVNYREVVRKVYWRRVDSAFEADWIYLEAARRVFPQSYQAMVGFRPAWFVHVDPEARFPRYVKTTQIQGSGKRHEGTEARRHEGRGVFIGPVEDKQGAQRLIELVEDAFDLCRYYNILTEAPQGKACAYKQMHKCPAPCDGSIPMEQYRRMIQWSAQVLVEPGEFIREHQRRMQQAAAALQFEAAGKIKAYIEQVSQFGQGSFRHARQLEEFCFLTLQRGPGKGTAKVFLITPGRIEMIASLVGEPRPGEVLRLALETAERYRGEAIDEAGAERIGLVARHLFSPKATAEAFVRLSTVDEKAVAKAWRDLQKQKVEAESEEEGVVKELQAM